MLKHDVCYGQTVTKHKSPTTNHTPPGNSVAAHVSIEVSLQNDGVPSWGTFEYFSQGLQEGQVLCPAI